VHQEEVEEIQKRLLIILVTTTSFLIRVLPENLIVIYGREVRDY